jgi:type II secretory pathway component PulF
MLSTLLRSGVPIASSLKIISNLMNNRVYRVKIDEANNRVLRGASMYEYMKTDEFHFPPFLSQMLNIGEKTGSIEETVTYVADTYEEELNADLKKLSSMVEPILLLVAGLAVGSIALSIILPIYQLPNLIK